MMERHYVIFVEFAGPIDGRKPLTQTLDVHSAGAEFSALLQVLSASSDIAALRVCNKTANGRLNIMTKDDLGMPGLDKIK